MWILTSLGRPERIRKVVDSYAWGREQVMLALYEKDKRLPEYLSQQWPVGWHVEIVPMLNNGPTYNEIFRRYPDETAYGFLADDALLTTPGMLQALEIGAANWNIAYANDGHWGDQLPTMPCLGGELVRAVGYLAPPHFMHWAIDTAWGELGKRLGNLRYFEHLRYTHENPVWGSAPDDATYLRARAASFGWQDILRAFMVGGEMQEAIDRVKKNEQGMAA